MNKFTPTLLALACALALTACNKQESPEETGSNAAPPTPAMPAPAESQNSASMMAPESSHQSASDASINPAYESSVKPPSGQ
jgi:hypothetical protein